MLYKYHGEAQWSEGLRSVERQLSRDAACLDQIPGWYGEITFVSGVTTAVDRLVIPRVCFAEQKLEEVALVPHSSFTPHEVDNWTVACYVRKSDGSLVTVAVAKSTRTSMLTANEAWLWTPDPKISLDTGDAVLLRITPNGHPDDLGWIATQALVRRGTG